MRSLVEARLGGPLAGQSPEDQPSVERTRELVKLVLGESTAQPIANVLFGMCRMEGNLDAAEEAVGNALRDRVNKVVETRNDIAHGDWVASPPGNTPWITRIRPVRKPPMKFTEYGPETLDRLSDELHTLELRVLDYGSLALGLWMLHRDSEREPLRERQPGELRVSDVLVKRGNEVLREGPKAHLVQEPQLRPV